VSSAWVANSTTDVHNNAKFGATWEGFWINGPKKPNKPREKVFYADESGNLHVEGIIRAS